MRTLAVMLALALPGAAAAAPLAALSAGTSASAQAADPGPMRLAMRRETLPAGGKLEEQPPAGVRYLYVVSGRLKVSDLVTGAEQVVEAGKMTAEEAGDWHVAEAVGSEPVTLYVIDRSPTDAGTADGAS
jgi:quercetin dioxygenase-like cupin family protein